MRWAVTYLTAIIWLRMRARAVSRSRTLPPSLHGQDTEASTTTLPPPPGSLEFDESCVLTQLTFGWAGLDGSPPRICVHKPTACRRAFADDSIACKRTYIPFRVARVSFILDGILHAVYAFFCERAVLVKKSVVPVCVSWNMAHFMSQGSGCLCFRRKNPNIGLEERLDERKACRA